MAHSNPSSTPRPHQGPVQFSGTLKVIECNGQRGPFNVGELTTCIGEFKVLDQWLEQFKPGVYEGNFWVSAIEPRSRTWKTRVFVEVRATVVDYQIFDVSDDAEPSTQNAVPERDPLLDDHGLQQEQASLPAGRATRATRADQQAVQERPVLQPAKEVGLDSSAPALAADGGDEADERLRKLFDEEMAAAVRAGISCIKLDPTVDRALFREQRDYLKNANYRFDASRQLWLPPGVDQPLQPNGRKSST